MKRLRVLAGRCASWSRRRCGRLQPLSRGPAAGDGAYRTVAVQPRRHPGWWSIPPAPCSRCSACRWGRSSPGPIQKVLVDFNAR